MQCVKPWSNVQMDVSSAFLGMRQLMARGLKQPYSAPVCVQASGVTESNQGPGTRSKKLWLYWRCKGGIQRAMRRSHFNSYIFVWPLDGNHLAHSHTSVAHSAPCFARFRLLGTSPMTTESRSPHTAPRLPNRCGRRGCEVRVGFTWSHSHIF